MAFESTPNSEECLVTNPLTGKVVNVLPLFELMHENYASSAGPEELSQRIQDVHDFVSTSVPDVKGSKVDVHQWAEMNYTLICFRKTFERMKA